MKRFQSITLMLLACLAIASSAFADEKKRVEEKNVIRIEAPHFKGVGLFRRGVLGVELLDIGPDLRSHFGASKDTGVLVGKVEADSPADKAGVRTGDVIISIDGEDVPSSWNVGRMIRDRKEGEQVKVGIVRNGAPQQLVATIVERERPRIEVHELLGREGLMIDKDGLKELRTYIRSPEWRAKTERMTGDYAQLQTRIKELETRLKELEKKLQK